MCEIPDLWMMPCIYFNWVSPFNLALDVEQCLKRLENRMDMLSPFIFICVFYVLKLISCAPLDYYCNLTLIHVCIWFKKSIYCLNYIISVYDCINEMLKAALLFMNFHFHNEIKLPKMPLSEVLRSMSNILRHVITKCK